MAISINNKLSQLATNYYISYGTPEQKKIDASVNNIKSKLKLYFKTDVLNIIEFGSYKRDTILPRCYDNNSDVDLMIVFNHQEIGVSPRTYRDYFIKFADTHYSRSSVFKSSPTVVLELDHIKYDLVPAIENTNIWNYSKTIHIPKNDSDWMMTDPHGFNNELTNANTRNSYFIKRLIRLFKAWNAKVGYPLESYQLEKEIVAMHYFSCKTLEDYFFYVIDWLPGNRSNLTSTQKITSLKENAKKVKDYIKSDNQYGAELWLGHILPM